MSKLAIRKAIESAVVDVLEPLGILVVCAGDVLPAAAPKEYVRLAVAFGKDNATEIGGNPRIERSVRLAAAVRTDPTLKADRNDVVCALVRSAFPYGEDLVRDGIRVNILTVDDGQIMPDGSYLHSPVYVNFMVWSAV